MENEVLQFNSRENVQASEFELLTATAFEIFNRSKVSVAVIEVGMGGLTDATNIIERPLATVISKISLDHQSFLGSTLEQIARQKAGIIKDHVPCVVDRGNDPVVLDVIEKTAAARNAPLILREYLPESDQSQEVRAEFSARGYHAHQQTNVGLAYEAVKIATSALGYPALRAEILTRIPKDFWPGRLQVISLEKLTHQTQLALLDGAHNADAARVLAEVLRRGADRAADHKVTWLLAMSKGKNAEEILRTLLKDGDSVVTVQFGPVDGMPWIRATPSHDLLKTAGSVARLERGVDCQDDVLGAIREAAAQAKGNKLVITGSLYLISDVLRLCRDADAVK